MNRRDAIGAIQAVCVLITNRDGSIVGVSRKDDHTNFGLPGGKIEHNESPEDAARRELYEETGIVVRCEDLKPLYTGEDETGTVVMTFYVEPGDYDPRSVESGIALWVGWAEVFRGSYGRYNRDVYKAMFREIPEFWAQRYGSEVLRRSIGENLNWLDLYYEERVRHEFGGDFRQLLREQLITACHPIRPSDGYPTLLKALQQVAVLRDKTRLTHPDVSVRVAQIHDTTLGPDWGIGIIVDNIEWLPKKYLVYTYCQ